MLPLAPAMLMISSRLMLMSFLRSALMSAIVIPSLFSVVVPSSFVTVVFFSKIERRPVTGLMRFSITIAIPLFAMKYDALPSTSRIVESGAFSMSSTRPKIPSTTSLSISFASARLEASSSMSMCNAFARGTRAFS